MILGWITRRQYLEHHDPDRWAIGRSEGSCSIAPGHGDTETQKLLLSLI